PKTRFFVQKRVFGSTMHPDATRVSMPPPWLAGEGARDSTATNIPPCRSAFVVKGRIMRAFTFYNGRIAN
ncbi:MAG: hypothetical protein SOZ99_03215, partial [Paraeggerthella sp.]|nr:hypothetical protein [Paraeggerthella sp.]